MSIEKYFSGRNRLKCFYHSLAGLKNDLAVSAVDHHIEMCIRDSCKGGMNGQMLYLSPHGRVIAWQSYDPEGKGNTLMELILKNE